MDLCTNGPIRKLLGCFRPAFDLGFRASTEESGGKGAHGSTCCQCAKVPMDTSKLSRTQLLAAPSPRSPISSSNGSAASGRARSKSLAMHKDKTFHSIDTLWDPRLASPDVRLQTQSGPLPTFSTKLYFGTHSAPPPRHTPPAGALRGAACHCHALSCFAPETAWSHIARHGRDEQYKQDKDVPTERMRHHTRLHATIVRLAIGLGHATAA